MQVPRWFSPLAIAVAVVTAAFLIAGVLGVPFRAAREPEGYDQSRLHWNTKNTTRFPGDLTAVAAWVSRAVYPATEPANTPDVVLLYDPNDWQGALAASSLLRPLNAVLLPATEGVQGEIDRLRPAGSAAFGGARTVLITNAQPPGEASGPQRITPAEIPNLLTQAGFPAQHVLIVNPNDPATALLAGPWAAFSGDLVVFSAADAPATARRYVLGDAEAEDATRIDGGSAAKTAVAFARFEDPDNPLFGWGMNGESLAGYRAYTLARPDQPAMAVLSANLARRGKIGPLLWSGEREVPQVVNNYLWSQRAAFWTAPNEGPFHHFWVLGDVASISFPAQGQADYAVEIGPYRMKGPGLAGMDMLAAVWVVLGAASALWIAFHAQLFLPMQHWVMRLAWPLLALMTGPFGIPLYLLAYRRPVLTDGQMTTWDRPLWLQALVATVSSVGFGGTLMVTTGLLMTLLGLPLFPNQVPWLFWLGAPMVLVMVANYVVAVAVSWPLYQTPMIAMLHGLPYTKALPKALPVVLGSMAAVSLAMFPGMWWLMMWNLPMMPNEESILWFGVMFFTVFLGLLVAWPFNYLFVRAERKMGLM